MEKTLPKNWVEPKLDEVVLSKKGKKPKILNELKFEGSVPYLDIKAFEKNEIRRFADVETSNLIKENEIAIVWDGARSGWVSKGKNGAVGSTLAIIKPICIESEFLYRFLQSKYNYLTTNTRGIGIPHVDPTVLWNINFPLPPLAEQQRIVAKLDELFGHLDTLKTRLNHIPQILKNFRQAVLTQAVTGKLTEDYRKLNDINHESNSKIVKEIISQAKNVIKLAKLPESNIFCDDWVCVLPEHVAKPEKYSLGIGPFGSNLKVSDYCETGKPLVFVRNIKANKFKDLDQKYISESKFHELLPHTVSGGDLLITKMGGPPGDCEIYPEDLDDAVVTSDCLIFKINGNYHSNHFYRNVINSDLIKYQLGLITKGVAQQKISLKRFKTILLPYTCIKEQTEIVKRVEHLFTKANAIEAQYLSLKTKIDSLPQAILAKAFKGELVEQLDTDGSAVALLEEIKRLKTEVNEKKVKRGRKK